MPTPTKPTSTKGRKLGKRQSVYWGAIPVKVNGKKTTKQMYSTIPQSIIQRLGISTKAPNAKAVAKVVKDKKGRLRLNAPKSSMGSQYILAADGSATPKGLERWTRVRLPGGVSIARAYAVLSKAKKIVAVKYPNGDVKEIQPGKRYKGATK